MYATWSAENDWKQTLWVFSYCFVLVSPNPDQSDNGGSLEAYQQAVGYERRAKHPDIFVTRGIYERAISEASKRRFAGEAGAEEALKMFWAGYCDALVRYHARPMDPLFMNINCLENIGNWSGRRARNISPSCEKRSWLGPSLGSVHPLSGEKEIWAYMLSM